MQGFRKITSYAPFVRKLFMDSLQQNEGTDDEKEGQRIQEIVE